MSGLPEGSDPAQAITDRITVRIERVEQITPEIKGFRLRAESGELPAFTAGAHVDFFLPTASGELRRPYSLVNPPWESDRYEFGVLRDAAGSGGSIYLHDRVAEGARLQISAPKNFFPLADDAEHHLLLAGGIGITPILCMARVLARANRSFELHYAARSEPRMAYREQVLALGEGRVRLYFDGGDPTRGVDLQSLLTDHPAVPARHLYVCGPVGMIDAARRFAAAAGWPQTQVHFEIFAAPAHESGDETLEVVLNSSGATFRVPADRSILDVLLEAGVASDFDCKVGICGLCAVGVLEGEPDHRDHILSDSEHANGMICTCVSRAKSGRLVLDL